MAYRDPTHGVVERGRAMIVLSAGMQKAGSAWYFNLTNDMLIASGRSDIRELRRQFRLGRFLTEVNCNIDRPVWWRLIPVALPHLLGRTYAIKTHEAPTLTVKALLRRGSLRATYIFRDPRDVVVSLYEHGKRLRDTNSPSSTGFDKLETINAAVEFVAARLPVWQAWTRTAGVMLTRYEDLVHAAHQQCARLADFLGLQIDQAVLDEIVDRHSADRAKARSTPYPLHFNRGVIGRWQQALSREQRALCNQRFGSTLEAMGYPV